MYITGDLYEMNQPTPTYKGGFTVPSDSYTIEVVSTNEAVEHNPDYEE